MYLKHVINDGRRFFDSYLCVWGIFSYLVNMPVNLPSWIFCNVHHITNYFFNNAL